MKTCLGKQIFLGAALIALSGCVSYPIAKNLQQQAKPLTLSQVAENPGASQGTVVIWGGRIIKTVNDVNSSAIYILKLPLAGSGIPLVNANASGRFIASSKGFLDPEIYKQGKLVTVAGAIAGMESQSIQKAKYNYPVLNIKQIHVWPVERRYYYYDRGWGWYYPYNPSWYWGWYPGWSVGWGWYYGGDWDRGYPYRGGAYHYQNSGQRGGAYHYQSGGHTGGAYHYQGGTQGGTRGGTQGGTRGGTQGGGHGHHQN